MGFPSLCFYENIARGGLARGNTRLKEVGVEVKVSFCVTEGILLPKLLMPFRFISVSSSGATQGGITKEIL